MTGSAPPDDRLREAIQKPFNERTGLLRRFRLRSLSYGGQVVPRNDEKVAESGAFDDDAAK
jgi:hypothetical protein